MDFVGQDLCREAPVRFEMAVGIVYFSPGGRNLISARRIARREAFVKYLVAMIAAITGAASFLKMTRRSSNDGTPKTWHDFVARHSGKSRRP